MRALALLIVAACGQSAATIDASSDGSVDGIAPSAHLVAYVSGGGPDITWFDVDRTTGALTRVNAIAAFGGNPSFLAIDPSATHLYAVSSSTNRVGAYAIDPTTGALTFINDVAAGGQGPTHLTVDRSGKYVLVASYNNGNIAVLPIVANGGLAAAQQTLNAGQMAHMIVTDATNKFVLVPCLGSNYVAQYTLSASGMLAANTVPTMMTATGAGPRHIAFAPGGTHAYLINELNSTLMALAFDAATGRLSPLQTISTRAAGATGNNTTAEVWVHPNGKFVYGSNRGDDNIVVFARGSDGMLALVEHTSTQGQVPRDFTLDPTGTFLYAANQNSNNVVPFRIDPDTGKLTPVASAITATTPQFVGIVALPAR